MKVTLIEYTGQGRMREGFEDTRGENAADLLIFTKSTRLNMSPGLLSDIAAWPWEKKLAELEYMAHTIPSSWEMVDYAFMVEGVTRAFTHQFVRSRQFSFAQQTMRVLDVSTGPGWDYHTGPTIGDHGENFNARAGIYHQTMENIATSYKSLIRNGVAIEDARGILPTNILTNIVGKCNMRTFVELVRKRSSPRTQSEYRDVLEAMKACVREVHPWIDLFIDRTFDRAANELCDAIKRWTSDLNGKPQQHTTEMIKLVDQMRGQS